jgi:hypothetical protein
MAPKKAASPAKAAPPKAKTGARDFSAMLNHAFAYLVRAWRALGAALGSARRALFGASVVRRSLARCARALPAQGGRCVGRCG